MKSSDDFMEINSDSSNIPKKNFLKSSNVIFGESKHKYLPTPEEFLDMFCPSNFQNMKFTKQLIDDPRQHGQIFNILDILLKTECINQTINDPATSRQIVETNGVRDNKMNLNHCTSKIGLVLSNSNKLCKCTINYNRIPSKRKANTELYQNDIQPKSQRLSCVNAYSSLNYCTIKSSYSLKFEKLEIISDKLNGVFCCQIERNVHYNRCVRNYVKIQSYILVKINNYSNLNKTHLNTLSLYTNIINHLTCNYIFHDYKPKINYLIKSSNNVLKRCFNTDLAIWDTRSLIKKIKSFYQQLNNNFLEINNNIFDNAIFLSIINLLSFITSMNNWVGKLTPSKFFVQYLKKSNYKFKSETEQCLVKNIGESIVKLLNRNSNISKLKIIRLVSFILFGMRLKLKFPIHTLKMKNWKCVLRWLCKYDSVFVRLYREIELYYIHRKIKHGVNCKKFIGMFYELFFGVSVQNERLINCIYECICGKLFNTYHQWNTHSLESNCRDSSKIRCQFNSQLIHSSKCHKKIIRLYNRSKATLVNQKNICCAFKYHILSKSRTCPMVYDN